MDEQKSAKELVAEYLPNTNIMQLATSNNDQPWACTVHYFSDDEFNLYWVSHPDTLHSQNIIANPKVSVAIVGHENTPDEKWIAGISIVGTAELVDEAIESKVAEGYASKTGRSALVEDIKSGNIPERFYKITPSKVVLFDTKNFKGNPRQEIQLTNS